MNFLMVKNNNDKHCIYDLSRYVWKVIFFFKKKKKKEKMFMNFLVKKYLSLFHGNFKHC